MATAMPVLDGAIVNVALPTIARELATTPAASVWIVNAFQLAVTISLLPLAALGDSLGYRRVYWLGLAVFTAASLACALAPTLFVPTLARAIQGFGAAGIMSVNIALVASVNAQIVSTAPQAAWQPPRPALPDQPPAQL